MLVCAPQSARNCCYWVPPSHGLNFRPLKWAIIRSRSIGVTSRCVTRCEAAFTLSSFYDAVSPLPLRDFRQRTCGSPLSLPELWSKLCNLLYRSVVHGCQTCESFDQFSFIKTFAWCSFIGFICNLPLQRSLLGEQWRRTVMSRACVVLCPNFAHCSAVNQALMRRSSLLSNKRCQA